MAALCGAHEKKDNHERESGAHRNMEEKVSHDFHVGERVIASRPVSGRPTRQKGTIRFIGQTHFGEGSWYGIELTGKSRTKGKNDGSVQGRRYFHCEPLSGVFVRETALEAAPLTAESDPFSHWFARSLRV